MQRHIILAAALCALLAGCGTPEADKANAGLNGDARLRVALAAEASGDRDLAVSMFNAAAALEPDNTQLQLRCAEGLTRNGQLNQAMALLSKRLKAAPRQPEVLETLGAIQVMAGDPSAAMQTLSQVLRDRPTDLRALTDQAVALDLLHRHAEAQALYQKALAQAPEDAAIRNDFALSLLLSGRPQQAREMLLPLRDATDTPQRVRTNLAIAAAASGHLGEATELLHGQVDNAGIALLTQAIAQQGGKAAGRPE